MRRPKQLAPGITAIALASTLFLAACGGGTGYGSTQSTTKAATATAAAATATQPATAPSTPATAAPEARATVASAANQTLGKTILVDSAGMTLYTYGQDTPGMSACSGGCASDWPPLDPGAGSPAAGTGVTGTLATITRSDGTKQVTYNGLPLYGWERDQKPGDVTGDGVGGFHVALP